MSWLNCINKLIRFLNITKINNGCSASLCNILLDGLETLIVGAALVTFIFGGIIGAIFIIYLLFFTRFWPLAVLYLIWSYIIDVSTYKRGGRRMEWVQGWTWWRILKNYFPIQLVNASTIKFDPERNYLFCCFPHGILPMGMFSAFATTSGGFKKLFPDHTSYTVTLTLNFYLPILRELFYTLGACSASSSSLNYLLGSGHGKIVALTVGGAEEAFYSRPKQYKIILKKRKGFIKIALKNGVPIVPVFSFGVTDMFEQLDNPKGSILRTVQDFIKRVTRVAPTLLLGRGLFKNTLSIFPFRKPITTVVGTPIEITKNENPTQEEIDYLHKKFIKHLTKLFEDHKHEYLQNSQKINLLIR